MTPSKACYDLIKPWEAEGGVPRFAAYQDDKGIWTIAWGHTRGVYPGMVCTLADAEQWIHEDVGEAAKSVNELVKTPLTQNQFDALVSWTFAFGHNRLAMSDMLDFLNKGQYVDACAELVRWRHEGQVSVKGLLRRRFCEGLLFLKD